MRSDLSEEEWKLLEPLLPVRRKRARLNDREIVSAIFHVLRTGVPWRDLPEHYGPYTTAYNRFNRWCRRGIWAKFLDKLASTPHADFHLFGQRFFEQAPPQRRYKIATKGRAMDADNRGNQSTTARANSRCLPHSIGRDTGEMTGVASAP
jgi:transposase